MTTDGDTCFCPTCGQSAPFAVPVGDSHAVLVAEVARLQEALSDARRALTSPASLSAVMHLTGDQAAALLADAAIRAVAVIDAAG